MNRQWVFFWTVTGILFDYLEPSIKHNKRFFKKIMGLELYHLQYALLTLMNAKAIGKAASDLQLLPH